MAAGDDYIVELKKLDLQNLLQQHFGSNLKVESFTSEFLTKPGDNYGSTILAVEVFYKIKGEDKLHKQPLVAKLVPQSPFLREVFNIGITFNKEVRTYTLVGPEFYRLQKENHTPENEILDIFPKFFGFRSNRQEDTSIEADETAVFLMENLKLSGYEIRDRRKGLNLDHMEMSVSKLAQFHALAVALKILKPQVFENTVMKACEEFSLGGIEDEERNAKWIDATIGYIEHIPECKPHLEKIRYNLQEDYRMKKNKIKLPPKEPFASMVHNDFWLNNMMFKYDPSDENRESPTGMKFVDFQVLLYDSPVRDLIFFLFSSSEDDLIENYYDHLIHLYHEHFVNVLEKLGCDIGPFSYEHFQVELNTYSPLEFCHILFMLNPICADSKNMEETSDISEESILKNTGGETYERRVKCLLKTFVGNGWLR